MRRLPQVLLNPYSLSLWLFASIRETRGPLNRFSGQLLSFMLRQEINEGKKKKGFTVPRAISNVLTPFVELPFESTMCPLNLNGSCFIGRRSLSRGQLHRKFFRLYAAPGYGDTEPYRTEGPLAKFPIPPGIRP